MTTFLIGSTLLQIVRNGEFKERHQFDREINVGCKEEDFTPAMRERITKDFKRTEWHDGFCLFGNQDDTFWQGEGSYFSLLGKFKIYKNDRVENMGIGNYLVWPKKHLKTLKQINYKGYTFNVPNYRFKWLEHYYGKHWEEEDLSWNWSNAANLKKVSENSDLG